MTTKARALLSSSSAKADDPVFRDAAIDLKEHGVLDARLRGHDDDTA
jgi:hypothetical protein